MKFQKKILKLLLFLAFPLLSNCTLFFEDEFFVPDDFFTIQEAIDFAEPGDTVFIDRGVYSPSTNGEFFPIFLKNGVSLQGQDPENTILDAENFDLVMDVFNYTSGTVSNFTLQNGNNPRGGGLFIENSSGIFQNLYVISNRADDAGSGIYVENSDGVVLRNIVVADNAVTSSSTEDPAQVEIVDSNVTFTNNTVAQGDSDGLRLRDGSTGTFENNIFYQNGSGGNGVGFADTAAATSANIQYNLCFANAEADFFLNGMNLTAQQANDLAAGDTIANNFSADPLFTNPGGNNFTLQNTSPAINAGDPNPTFNNPDGSRNTLGAFGGPQAINP